MTLGVRMALERRTGRDSLVRTGTLAATFGVLAVVAVFTVRHGILETVDDPARAGQTWELAYYPALSERVIEQNPDIAAAAKVRRAQIDLDGVAVGVYAMHPIGTPIDTVVISGRAPGSPDEIALGPSSAQVLGVGVGDTVAAGARSLTVVGTVLLWEEGGHSAYDEGGWMTNAGFARTHTTPLDWEYDFIHVRPGADPVAVDRQLLAAGAVESPAWPPPAAVRNLNTARRIPVYLSLLFAVMGVGAVGYAIVATARRRRDVATLRALGMSRRSAISTLAWQASTVAVIGVAFGVPLGVIVGDLVWKWISDAMPLQYVTPTLAPTTLLVIPVALLAVNLAAVWPAWSNLRPSPAAVLRAE
jgi:hypothetical protein